MASQAQTLLAVIAGSTRRKVEYWVTGVLRSTLYSVPQSESETTQLSSILKNMRDFNYNDGQSRASASLAGFELRSILITKSVVESEKTGVFSALSTFSLETPSYEIEIDSDDAESSNAFCRLSTFSVVTVKITSSQVEPEKSNAIATLSSFSIT